MIPEGGAPPPHPPPPIMTELIRFLMVRSCVMTRTMHAWRKANAYVRSGQHDRAIYWLSRTQAILDAGRRWIAKEILASGKVGGARLVARSELERLLSPAPNPI